MQSRPSPASSLSSLPQVETLLQTPEVARWAARLSRKLLARIVSTCVAEARQALQAGGAFPGVPALIVSIEAACRKTYRRRVIPVINATGVALHTNMGRAPLAPVVWQRAREVNTGYSNLELDLETGKRGRRSGIVPELLSLWLGAEDALVVNNNAAAVFLTLTALASGREVIVSRGQQVQIGGGFRIPEILSLSGARLVEVGTTNITRLEDYTAALGPETAMVLVVHSSNFRIRGFTASPSAAELAAALPPGVILAVDQGSGTTSEQLPGEQSVAHYLRSGASLVSFSGDKVLGGPQAGLIVGRRALIQTLYGHPLNRAFRPGKTIYSLLEELLIARLNGDVLGPAESLAAAPAAQLRRRAGRLVRRLGSPRLRVVPAPAATGGGSAPDEGFPSFAVEVEAPEGAESLLARLRDGELPVLGTISSGKVLLNLATVRDAELPALEAALSRALGSSREGRG